MSQNRNVPLALLKYSVVPFLDAQTIAMMVRVERQLKDLPIDIKKPVNKYWVEGGMGAETGQFKDEKFDAQKVKEFIKPSTVANAFYNLRPIQRTLSIDESPAKEKKIQLFTTLAELRAHQSDRRWQEVGLEGGPPLKWFYDKKTKTYLTESEVKEKGCIIPKDYFRDRRRADIYFQVHCLSEPTVKLKYYGHVQPKKARFVDLIPLSAEVDAGCGENELIIKVDNIRPLMTPPPRARQIRMRSPEADLGISMQAFILACEQLEPKVQLSKSERLPKGLSVPLSLRSLPKFENIHLTFHADTFFKLDCKLNLNTSPKDVHSVCSHTLSPGY